MIFIRRRMKIIPNAWGERTVLKLMFGAMIRASERWCSVRALLFEWLQLEALKEEFDGDTRGGSDPFRKLRQGHKPEIFQQKWDLS